MPLMYKIIICSAHFSPFDTGANHKWRKAVVFITIPTLAHAHQCFFFFLVFFQARQIMNLTVTTFLLLFRHGSHVQFHLVSMKPSRLFFSAHSKKPFDCQLDIAKSVCTHYINSKLKTADEMRHMKSNHWMHTNALWNNQRVKNDMLTGILKDNTRKTRRRCVRWRRHRWDFLLSVFMCSTLRRRWQVFEANISWKSGCIFISINAFNAVWCTLVD